MSAAHRISQKVQSRTQPTSAEWDSSLTGEPSDLLARLRKIRARSTTTTKGSFVSPAPQAGSSADKRPVKASFDAHPVANDELHWQDHLLTWTRGNTLMRTLSFTNPILQAFWTHFQVSSPDDIMVAPGRMRTSEHPPPLARALCIFFEQAIHIHFPGLGEQVDMDLPFRFAKAFPAPMGFLVQRQIESEDERIASRLHKPASMSSLHQGPSNIGYPFPDLSQSSDSGYDLSNILDDTNQASTSQLYDDATRLLPMVFYLSRCYDDLVPVDRFPQLSFASESTHDVIPMTHGPASPFGEMDESVIFVSTKNDERCPPFIVTISRRNSAIRVYAFAARSSAFEATATLLSTPRVPSSLHPSGTQANGVGGTVHSQMPDSLTHDEFQQSIANGKRAPLDTPAAMPSSTALGRGFPSTVRRSARIDLERRSSGLPSAGMGRDPSGRSRRISAMHTSTSDRRSTGRKEDQAGQGRDRTLGNISHTADGLRLQSQPYQHDAMMEELGNAGTSMRINTNQASAARLRRSSQAAARTPYGGPRMSNRTASSAIKVRPSMNLSRLDSSMDTGRLTSAMAPNATDGIRADTIEAEAGLGDHDDADLARIADLDSFARSFACVCLLDEIKVPGLGLEADRANVQVRSAAFDRVDADASYIFLSIPATNQTFCRRLGYQRVGNVERTRKLPFCKVPNKTQASAVIPCSSVMPVRLISADSTEVISMLPDGTVQLHFGPPSSTLPPLDISSFGPLLQAVKQFSLHADSLRFAADTAEAGSTLRLVSDTSEQCVNIDLTLRPKCSTTDRILTTMLRALPTTLAAKITSRWIQTRFLSGNKALPQNGRAAAVEDWSALLAVFRTSVPASKAQSTEATAAETDGSIADRLFGDDPLLSGLAPLASAESTPPSQRSNCEVNDALDGSDARQVLLVLYLLAEETRLDSSHPSQDADDIVQLALATACTHGASAWVEALCCRFPLNQAALDRACFSPLAIAITSPEEVADVSAPPPDLYQVLLGIVSGKAKQTSSLQDWISRGDGNDPKQLKAKNIAAAFPLVVSLLRTYAVFGETFQSPKLLSAAIIDSMLSHGLNPEQLRMLPFGVALPLYQALRYCQIDPPSGRSAAFYQTVQRAELVLNASSQRGSLQSAGARKLPEHLIRTLPDDAPLDAICAQLFSRDFRLKDVVAMLQTDSINSIYVAEGENQTEAAITEQHNAAVAAVNERTKALPTGRAMLFMTSRPFSPTHKWRISSICLAVKVRPRGTTIEPDSKAEATGLDWPEFHNGVASVLELNLPADVSVDAKWIFAHLGEQVTARHAGFLYGLGLMKQLPTLTPVHVFRYLKMRNNLLTIGFLLGMAVSTVGTADPTARHLIGMQLTAFLPPGSAPLNLSTITQTAGLLAMGLVFLGSNHRWTAKRMLEEIGAAESPTPNIQPQHREAYSMSAGLALGLVYLGKGRSDGMKSLPDKRIVSRLAYLVTGSRDATEVTSFKGTSRSADALKDDLEVNLTSAPAALAFGLIYLRSGSQMVANVMAPPQTPHELDTLRPDVLFAHVLARSLILWDTIEPTRQWIETALPEWMQTRIKSGRPLSEAAQLAQINMQASACFALGLKYAGSKDQIVRNRLWEHMEKLEQQVKVETVSFFSKIRKAAVRAALDQVRISLSMVFAGSGDINLLRHLRRAHGDVDGDICYGSHMAAHMAIGLLFLGGGRFTLGTSDLAVAALLISFLPPFPRWSGDNRAHLQAFRNLWYLAIEPRLLVATDIDTNQLVSLPVKTAAKEELSKGEQNFTPLLLPNRQLTGPIESATLRYWPASIASRSTAERAGALTSAASLSRASSSTTSQILFVRRKTAHLDYTADPHGSRSLSTRAVETAPMEVSSDATGLIGPGLSELREAMRGFAGAGKHRELIRSLCQASEPSKVGQDEESNSAESLLRMVTMECLTMDKMYILPAYMSIAQLASLHESEAWALMRHYRDIRFADEFYRHHYDRLFSMGKAQEFGSQMQLVQPRLVSSLRIRAQQQSQQLFEVDPTLQLSMSKCLTSREEHPITMASESLWTTLIGSEVPSTAEVRDLIHVMSEYVRSAELNTPSRNDEARAAQTKAGLRMITDTAFGGAGRPPWTTYILDHIIEKLVRS